MAAEDKLITIGIASITLQEISATGTDVGTPIELGDTLLDSFTITNDEGTAVEIFVEELSNAIYNRAGDATTSVTWQSPNADMESVAKVTGGTWDTATDEYEAPLKAVNKDFRVVVTPEQGWVVTLNRVNITANFDGNFGKNNALMLTVNGSVLSPVDGTTPPATYKKKA